MNAGDSAGGIRMFPVAIDYGRFSNTVQEMGDSKHRQKSLADAWSERTGVPIDLRLCGEGESGYKNQKQRLTDDTYTLGHFLKLIEARRVQPGDYLLLDNLDRLSRDKEVRATHLLTSILVAGVHVVQLAPAELELTENSDMFTVFRAVLELSRGHGESERKHQVCSASYASNRAAATTAAESYQGALPAWVRREGNGKGARNRAIHLIPERADVVKLVYGWAADGLGYTAIVQRLISEEVPPFGDREPRIDPETGEQARTRKGRLRWKKVGECMGAGRWTRAYIVDMLRDKAAMGLLTTRTGEVVPIPAAVTEDEWMAAQAGREERDKHRGRSRKAGPENLFQGLLTDARTGEGYFAITRQGRGRQWRVLINAGGKAGESEGTSFPEPVFEAAVLSCLREIDPAEVTAKEGPDRVAVLAGRLEQVLARLADLTEELRGLEKKPRGALQVMAELEEEAEQLEEARRRAEQEARHPHSEAWGQAKSLLDTIDTPEKRRRFRSLLRRLVAEILVLVVPRGWDRLAAVQMRFKGAEQSPRNYLILYRKDVMPTGLRASRRKGERGEDTWQVRSTAEVVPNAGTLDLRNPDHVTSLEAAILAWQIPED